MLECTELVLHPLTFCRPVFYRGCFPRTIGPILTAFWMSLLFYGILAFGPVQVVLSRGAVSFQSLFQLKSKLPLIYVGKKTRLV